VIERRGDLREHRRIPKRGRRHRGSDPHVLRRRRDRRQRGEALELRRLRRPERREEVVVHRHRVEAFTVGALRGAFDVREIAGG